MRIEFNSPGSFRLLLSDIQHIRKTELTQMRVYITEGGGQQQQVNSRTSALKLSDSGAVDPSADLRLGGRAGLVKQ